jgi:hypothetical protein
MEFSEAVRSFLDCCDRYGLYVEEESAVCFVDQAFGSRIAAQDDPRYTAQFMNQFAEMIERDRDHPSVIIWSLGNESQWGVNFAKEYSYVKLEDTTRPVIFSFPDSVPNGVKAYDIFSKHYPKFDSDFSSVSLPRLNDEFGHIPCYNQETQRRDPGVRNYWGKSIKEFWQRMSVASGCLGGSIWASIDEVFMLPGSCVGYGEWGIIDGWRREKPEHWLTKKAYSPTQVPDSYVENPGSGSPLRIPIKNQFNHTNPNEIRIEWSVGSDHGEIRNLNVAPRATGWLVFPTRAWSNGETVHIRFISKESRYQVRIDGAGLITTNFKVQEVPPAMNEIGVAYVLPVETDQLSWSRKSLWSVYPPDHIGRSAGIANKMRRTDTEEYRAMPSWPWSQDMKDFFLFGKDDAGGRGTNDFRSQKQNIWYASGIVSRTGVQARVESEASHSVRAEIQRNGHVRLNVNSAWAYPNLDWGNECATLPAGSDYDGSIRLRLTDADPISKDSQQPS